MQVSEKDFREVCLAYLVQTYGSEDITEEAVFPEYFDPLDLVEIIIWTEKMFNIKIKDPDNWYKGFETISDLLDHMGEDVAFVQHLELSEVTDKVGKPFPPPVSKIRKVIYISGKVTGIETTAVKLFKDAQRELEAIGYEVINPMELPADHDRSWRSYMRTCIAALAYADCMFMLENWQESKGAKIELEMGSHLCLDIIYQENQ